MCIAVALLALTASSASADEPLTQRFTWDGTIDYFASGAALAEDGPDMDTTTVDRLLQPNSITITAADIPMTAGVRAAYLFWAGTINDQNDCSTTNNIDDTVALSTPGQPATQVTADVCYCASGAGSYDIQACRADITSMVTASGMLGTFTVDQFAAKASNGATDNASFSVVLVYEQSMLPPRSIGLYDGVEELSLTSRTITLSGLDVDTPAVGDLTWYVLDGDVGGTGTEQVQVQGIPGSASSTLSDAVNPANNPMNRTINTSSPAQTGIIGVDIDRFDISAGLTPGDTALDMTYSAGNDKWWVVFNVVGINVFKPNLGPKSRKLWNLEIDADGNSAPSPGDTIRYTIDIENNGTAPGSIALSDDIPAQASSWNLVDGAGGINASSATQLVLTNISVPAGATVQVVFDMVLSPSSAGQMVVNTVILDSTPDGNITGAVSPSFTVVGNTDAGVPDAAPPFDAVATDAGAPDAHTADAAAPMDALTIGDATSPDALLAPDAGEPGVATGCCRTDGGGAPLGTVAWALLVLALTGRARFRAARRGPRRRR